VNPEKVVFGFFILLALTLNVGFVYGEIDNPNHHHVWEFAVGVSRQRHRDRAQAR
jgi:hypothetical protein